MLWVKKGRRKYIIATCDLTRKIALDNFQLNLRRYAQFLSTNHYCKSHEVPLFKRFGQDCLSIMMAYLPIFLALANPDEGSTSRLL